MTKTRGTAPPHIHNHCKILLRDQLFWHLWTMHHLNRMKQNNVGLLLYIMHDQCLVQQPSEWDLKTHSSLPEPYPTILNHISLYIMNFLSGQTVYLDNQPTHWCVHFCVGFSILRFPLSAALSLIIRSDVVWLLLCSVAEDVLLPALHLSKVKFCARHPLEDVLDVITGGLKVSCGVV